MPIYVLKCSQCGHIQEELMGVSELQGLDPENLDLSELKVACKNCGKHRFSKQVAAHGKTAHNWSAWQREP
jgi:predicted nucleic acid-binding Zn ribbon protein